MTTSAVPPSGPPRPERRATIEDWLAIPEEQRAELIDGRIVHQGMPGPVHGRAQGRLVSLISRPFDRRQGSGDLPGGWWISMEVDMFIAGLGCRPDLLGWRRDRHAAMPQPDSRGLVTVAPDWVCEVLSPTNANTDLKDKRVGYHRAGIEHYWIVDPVHRNLTIHRRDPEYYAVILVATKGDVVHAPPFDAVELDISELFGDDEPEPEAAPPAGG